MPKATLVTIGNKETLEKRFVRDESDELKVGLYLVADFGADENGYELLQPSVLDEAYHRGVSIGNDFFEITRKDI